MAWLRRIPQCRCEGDMVHVTLELKEGYVAPGRYYLRWKACGHEVLAPLITDPLVVCCLPKHVFQDQALIVFELVPKCSDQNIVKPWTPIVAFAQASFWAYLSKEDPVLGPAESNAEMTHWRPVGHDFRAWGSRKGRGGSLHVDH